MSYGFDTNFLTQGKTFDKPVLCTEHITDYKGLISRKKAQHHCGLHDVSCGDCVLMRFLVTRIPPKVNVFR